MWDVLKLSSSKLVREESFVFNLNNDVFKINADDVYVINTLTLDYADKCMAFLILFFFGI